MREAAVVQETRQSPSECVTGWRLLRSAKTETRFAFGVTFTVMAGLVPAIIVARCRYGRPGQARP